MAAGRKLVTDEDVERYLYGPKSPPKKGGKDGRGPIMELFALCCPPDDPFVDRNIRKLGGLREEARRREAEEHPPSPVRIIMKNGVYVEPEPPAEPPSAEPTPSSRAAAWMARKVAEGSCRRCGKGRGEDGSETYCRPCADHMSDRARDKRRQWGPDEKARAAAVNKARRVRLIAEGKCRRCGKPRDTGLAALCGVCSEKAKAMCKRRKARRRAERA